MSPFQEFRYWLRRAPRGERFAVAVAGVVAIALVGWLLVPGADEASEELATTATGPAASEPAPGAGTAAAASTPAEGPIGVAPAAADSSAASAVSTSSGARAGAGSAPAAAAPAPASAGAAGAGPGAQPGAAKAGSTPACPPGADRGINGSQLKVGVGLVNIAGPVSNSLLGIPAAGDQRAAFEAVIAAVNAEGGAGCKRIVAEFFELNPANQDDLAAKCRAVDDAKVFAFVDAGGYATFPQVECFGQRRIPYFGGFFTDAARRDRNYPYLFNLNLFDYLYRTTPLALKERGVFDPANGFKKLGFFHQNCNRPLVDVMRKAIRDAGIPDSQVDTFDAGCSSATINPAVVSQAVFQFNRNGVTHVMTNQIIGDVFNFSQVAAQQRFKPKYVLADDGLVSISYGPQQPDHANFDGTIAITTNRGGEERTPGLSPTAGSLRCSKAYASAGINKPVSQLPYLYGNACNQFWMLKAAMDNAATLRGDALAAGLQKAKTIDFSYPQAPADFTAPRATTGGQQYRAVQWTIDCKCWRVVERTFRPVAR